MSSIEQTLKEIRPKLRLAAPQTFWFSVGFGVFNVLVGVALFQVKILTTLDVVGVIPLPIWGIIFLVHGVSLLGAVAANDWRLTWYFNVFGIAIKTAWWLELLSITITGRSPFLLYVWSLLLYFQAINVKYFAPEKRDG